MHLFLEGSVQAGKSTLLRACIATHACQLGGFSSQRLWHEGKPCGYRLVPAEDLELDREYEPGLSGIFAGHIGDVSLKDSTVFETLGVRLLSESLGKPLILLDEIGGAELLVPAFRRKLYQVLAGSAPCIGVLKLSDNADFMGRTAGYPAELVERNRQLRRDLLLRFDSEILAFSRSNQQALQGKIQGFLQQVWKEALK